MNFSCGSSLLDCGIKFGSLEIGQRNGAGLFPYFILFLKYGIFPIQNGIPRKRFKVIRDFPDPKRDTEETVGKTP
jgi:hypothetical protein